MTLELGRLAPDFEQDTANGSIRFHEWLRASWGVLFSHSRNFDPLCAAELAEVARLKPEWARRNVKPIALSLDTAESNRSREFDIEERLGQKLNFPLIADVDRQVSLLYGLVHSVDPAAATHSLIVIDPKKIVRATLAYPPGVRRNFIEILRVIDGLKLTDAESRVMLEHRILRRSASVAYWGS